jgi:hypothetical protein
MMAKKDDWVLIHKIVLQPAERAPVVPDDTKKVPYEMWVKGRLAADAEIGSEVEVFTRTGRTEKGKLLEVNPAYKHSFGEFVPELLTVSENLRKTLFEGGAV